jgi:hypothetical protein
MTDVELFLEHHGVKGMKWGVRKERRLETFGNPKVKPLTPNQKRARTNRRVRRVKNTTTAVRLAAGTLFVVGLLSSSSSTQHRATKAGSFTSPAAKRKAVTDLIDAERKVKVDAIIRTHKEGHIDKAQLDYFLKGINNRYDRIVVDAFGKL